MKVRKIKRKDGSVITVTENEKGEYVCDGYDPENDIVKPHKDIVCKVVDIDLKIDEVLTTE